MTLNQLISELTQARASNGPHAKVCVKVPVMGLEWQQDYSSRPRRPAYVTREFSVPLEDIHLTIQGIELVAGTVEAAC